MYSNLTTAAGGITAQTLPDYFKDATFGVPAGDVESTESPEPGATIVRDSRYGVPHIYGDTRAELMFAIGYATAEDRLFFIDALRHAGNGDLAAFAGGANVSMDEQVWAGEPYTHQDLVNQVQYGLAHEPDGAQVYADATAYVDGINAYISKAAQPLNTLTMEPAEYVALGMPNGPQPFSLEDLVSIATLVGGIFGNGGGSQLNNAVLYENLARRFGGEHRSVFGAPVPPPTARRTKGKTKRNRRRAVKLGPDHSGLATFLSFDAANDPEAPTTVAHTVFPYQTLPKPSKAVARTVALPDYGSVGFVNHVVAGAAPQTAHATVAGAATGARAARAAHRGHVSSAIGPGLGPQANAGPGLLAFPRSMSNALLVSAKDSASGHPLAVMGPQVSYFAPQILMEEDIHGPGIDADGAAFPGVNLYVELGHGTDYAWSATSAGQNIIDTFAVPLCNPAGGPVTADSNYYKIGRQCVAMETLTDHESWSPNLADSTPAGSITLQTQRTAYGLVIARARVKGQPVVYTNLRSTYMHELESAAGFEKFNEPDQMRTPQQFMQAANEIGYTFNWFYTNNQHIAYFNSGLNPVRAAHTDPLFPAWARNAWPGLEPAAAMTPQSLLERDTPMAAHPQVVDQPVLTSWNNKQAPGFGDPSHQPAVLLDLPLPAAGQQPQLLPAPDRRQADPARSRQRDGYRRYAGPARRRGPALGAEGARSSERPGPGHGDRRAERLDGQRLAPDQPAEPRHDRKLRPERRDPDHGCVVAAAGPGRVHARAGERAAQPDRERVRDQRRARPRHQRRAPRLIMGRRVLRDRAEGSAVGAARARRAGKLNRVFCGSGSLTRCRAALVGSLRQAIAETPDQVYPADGVCPAGDQMCSDSIQFRAIGAIKQPLIEWVNRPTFQQADEIQGHQGG